MNRNKLSAIKLTDYQKKKLKEEIIAFYLDVRGEEIGIIEQQQLMELFTENLAPIIYNKALDDVKNWHRTQLDNMESDYYLLYQEEKDRR